MRLLMVCLGNICRSPLAEGIMRKKIIEHNLLWTVDSAGTSGWHAGELPDSRTIKCAKDHGIDISDQRSRQFTKADFKNFDLIFAMDESNYNDILMQAHSEEDGKKVHLLLTFADMIRTDVPDPYYGGSKSFENVFQLLDDACTDVLEKLVHEQAAMN
ncbi:MAG: low molecular weight protein-tyrosine-phosphatase [Bacteroidia bacterium]